MLIDLSSRGGFFARNVVHSVKGIAFSHRREIMNRRQFLGTMMAMGAMLAACAAPPAQPAQPAQPANTAAPDPTAAATAAPEPTKEVEPTAAAQPTADAKTLTIGTFEEPDTLNPLLSPMFVTQKIMYGVMSPLINFDEKFNIVPALAESHSISDDGLSCTFNLRKGVKWHDGQPFTAADVVATQQFLANPKSGTPFAGGWERVDKIETPDEHTVIATFKEPYAPFLYNGANFLVAPKHHIDKGLDDFKQQFGRNPVGTGLFKFVKWDSAQQIVLERNPDYYGPTPGIDKIVFRIVPNLNTLVTQVKTGEIQMTDNFSAVEIKSLKDMPNLDIQSAIGLSFSYLILKNIDFLMDKRVRQALDFATPRQQILDQLFDGNGQVAFGDQSPITPFYNPNITPRLYDLDKAAALLAEAGFAKNANGILEKDGKPLKIEYWIGAGGGVIQQMSQVIAASWRKLGVDVEENQQDFGQFFTADGALYRKAMTATQIGFTNYPDPDDMLLWHSDFIPKEPGGMGFNFPAIYNPYEQQAKFDELTAAGARETDLEKRKQIYWQIQELLHEEMPVIFLYWPKRVFVAPKNLRYTTNAGMPLLFNAETWSFAS
jgi:peptide/nickel transport system substrate-binding protein